MARNYWLVKVEPEAYSWTTFVKESGAAWTGVRNFQARNNLRAMRKGDLVFYYHADSLLLTDAVVIENQVSLPHRAQIVSRLEIADTGPGSAAFLHKSRPRVRFRFHFHQPVVPRHAAFLFGTRNGEKDESFGRDRRPCPCDRSPSHCSPATPRRNESGRGPGSSAVARSGDAPYLVVPGEPRRHC